MQRVEKIISEPYVDLLLRAYRSAQRLLATNEDGVLVIHRVMDLCAKYAGADVVVQKFVPAFMDDLVSRKFEEVMLSETISVSMLVHKAVCFLQNALMQCEARAMQFFASGETKTKCAAICRLATKSMHAPTIVSTVDISVCIATRDTTLAHILYLEYLDSIDQRKASELKGCLLSNEDSSVSVVKLLSLLHNRKNSKFVYENVDISCRNESLNLSPPNTIFVSEMSMILYHRNQDENIEAVLLDLADISAPIVIDVSTVCFVQFELQISFQSRAEAQAFVSALQRKRKLFVELDERSRRAAIKPKSFEHFKKSKSAMQNKLKKENMRQKRASVVAAPSLVPASNFTEDSSAAGRTPTESIGPDEAPIAEEATSAINASKTAPKIRVNRKRIAYSDDSQNAAVAGTASTSPSQPSS